MTTKYYTPDLAGSGQFGICDKCKKPPSIEGHDGCLGTLPGNDIMNACCGHGLDKQAYIQFWDGLIICGNEAIREQKSRLKMFKSDKELMTYLKDGGVIKPVGVLPSVYTWVQLKAGEHELLNGYPAHNRNLSHEYWERADTAGDLAIIEFFKRGVE